MIIATQCFTLKLSDHQAIVYSYGLLYHRIHTEASLEAAPLFFVSACFSHARKPHAPRAVRAGKCRRSIFNTKALEKPLSAT